MTPNCRRDRGSLGLVMLPMAAAELRWLDMQQVLGLQGDGESLGQVLSSLLGAELSALQVG